MASSSGSWLFILVILVAGALFILTANQANHNFFKSGTELRNEGGKFIDDFVGKFSKAEPHKPPPSTKSRSVPNNSATSEHQKDELGRKDRAELNDLLNQVTK